MRGNLSSSSHRAKERLYSVEALERFVRGAFPRALRLREIGESCSYYTLQSPFARARARRLPADRASPGGTPRSGRRSNLRLAGVWASTSSSPSGSAAPSPACLSLPFWADADAVAPFIQFRGEGLLGCLGLRRRRELAEVARQRLVHPPSVGCTHRDPPLPALCRANRSAASNPVSPT